MSSALIKVIKRSTCALLCYGMVFSYPSWTIFGRVAHASQDAKANANVDLNLDDVKDPAPKASKPKSEGKPAAKSKTSHSGEKPKGEKKVSEAPVGGSCSEDKFFLGATSSGSMNLFSGDAVCSPGQRDPLITSQCWTQFFIFIGAAEANAYYVKGTPDRSPAPGVAARTLSTVKEFVPKVGDELSKTDNEEALAKILDKMSRPDLIKNQDNKQCCLQLVEQARKVATFIKGSSTNPSRKDLTPSKAQLQKMDSLIAQKQAQCSSGGVVVGGGGHATPAQPAAAKKDNKGLMLGIFLALIIGLAIWASNSKKKKKGRPTETPPPICKGKKCGGGTTAEEPPPPCSTGNCGNNVGTTTAEEPPVTTGTTTYPATTGETTRGNSTGETGGDTYPNTNGDTTRGNSTGETGTVTGSTTASTSSENPSTNGSTNLDEPVGGGDNPGRNSGGEYRPGGSEPEGSDGPGRTLIK